MIMLPLTIAMHQNHSNQSMQKLNMGKSQKFRQTKFYRVPRPNNGLIQNERNTSKHFQMNPSSSCEKLQPLFSLAIGYVRTHALELLRMVTISSSERSFSVVLVWQWCNNKQKSVNVLKKLIIQHAK